jgi:hypothetical protein
MRVISGIIGLVLILVAVVIIVLSTSSETKAQAQNKLITKYVEQSKGALLNHDFQSAIKFAKMAIEVNPTNKEGFKALETALEIKYKPAVIEETEDVVAPKKKPKVVEAEDEMGC